MIVVKDEITPTMREIAQQAPDIFAGALKDVGLHLRKLMSEKLKYGRADEEVMKPLDSVTLAIRAAVKGGLIKQRRKLRASGFNSKMKAVQKITGQLRRFRGGDERLGGELAHLFEYVAGEASVDVGWMGRIFKGVESAALRFQAGMGPKPYTQQQLRQFAVLLGPQFKQLHLWSVPYLRPERPVIRAWERGLTAYPPDVTDVFRKAFMARLERLKVKNA